MRLYLRPKLESLLYLQLYVTKMFSIFAALLIIIPSTAIASAYNGYYHKNTGSDFSFYDGMALYGTPAIDGKIGENEWNASYSRQIYKYDRDDNRIRYMFQYDTSNLYILIEVDDDKIWDDSPGEVWQTNQDDGVEIYIDPDSSRDSVLTKNDRVVAFTVAGRKYRFDQGNNAGSTEYYGEFSQIKKAVGIKGSVNDSSNTDIGYVVEVAIPWSHLGGVLPTVVGSSAAETIVANSSVSTSLKDYISLNIIVVEDDDGGSLNVNYDETRWNEPFEIDRYFKWFGDGLNGPKNYAKIYLLPSADNLPPAAVSDISFIDINPFSAVISFTAPADNYISLQTKNSVSGGAAVKYHIRYSKNGQISTEEAWSSAAAFENRFIPKIGGKQETLRITGLEPETVYYFAVRAEDGAGNLSPLAAINSTSSTALTQVSCTTPKAPSSYGKGKIYPSAAGRFFIYADGTPFMPVTEPAGITWLGIRDLYDFPLWDDTFKKLINWHESSEAESALAKNYIQSLSEKGINLIRIFIEDLAFAHSGNPHAPEKGVSYLEFPATDKGENYLNETLKFLDSFMSLCQDNGIYVTITSFDTYFYKDYWDYNPYNIQNGGMLSSPDDFVTDKQAVSAQKKRLQVLYDVVKKHHNFFGWEMMNEWDNNTFASQPQGWENLRIEWIKDLLGYLRAIDNRNMVFISSVIWQPQFELKDFVLLSDYFDFVCVHNYTKSIKDPTASGDINPSIRPAWDSKRLIQYMTGNTVDFRPILDLEFGPISLETYSKDYTLEDDEETFHNIIWSEFASGAAGMGLRWPGKTLEHNGPRLSDKMLDYQKNMSDYFSQTEIDFKNLDSFPFERHVKVIDNTSQGVISGGEIKSLSEGVVKVFASSNGKAGVIYLLNSKENVVINPSVEISNLSEDGEYKVEIWDTRADNQTILLKSVESKNRTLTFAVPPFERDYFAAFSLTKSVNPLVIAPPVLSVSKSGLHVDLKWTIPAGSDGVILYYAPADLSYIGSINMGKTDILPLDLFKGFDYYAALTAYSRTGLTSGYSNLERITIP